MKSGETPLSALTDADDLKGDANKIKAHWYVKEKLPVSEQTESGRILRRKSSSLYAGDFIDVAVFASIRRAKGLNLYWTIKSVTVLKRKSNVSNDP